MLPTAMVQPERELDLQATRLVRRAIVHHSMERDYRYPTFPREELLDDGYSHAVVRRAKYSDDALFVRRGWVSLVWIGILGERVTKDKHWAIEIFLGALVITMFIGLALYRLYRSRRTRPTPEDDRLVIEELSARLGPETIIEAFYADEYSRLFTWRNPQPRKALLWRLDAFLSRRNVSS